MFKKTKLCKGLLLAFGGTLAFGALPAHAQDAQATQLDRVEVTGSSIKRLAAEQSLPVTVLKAEDLAKAGVTNAEQAMAFIASNQSSTTSTASVGASNGGSAFADLRGLGASRTLVLVNGKRMVNNPYLTAAVDLNALPFGAVERIEVLSDGASAIYGSDAIAGVVNFITRKEFVGINAQGDASLPQQSGGGERYSAGITGGFGSLADQKFNIFGGISWSKQNALPSIERDYAKTAYVPDKGYDKTSGTTFPANYFQGENVASNPTLPGCAPPYSLPIGSLCRFDYVPFIDIIPQQEQYSFIAKGSLAVNKDNTVSLEYIQANNKLATAISPTPVTGSPAGPLFVPPNNPYFPGAGITPGTSGLDPTQDVSTAWRTYTLGGRASEFKNDTNRILLNWEGTYKGWDYSATAFQSKADVTQNFTGGYVNSTLLQNGLSGTSGAPWLNPFGDQTADGAAFLTAAQVLGQVQKATGTLKDFTANVSGEVAKLPAGPMLLAVGVEFLKDEADYTNNFALIRQAASSGLELSEDSSGSRRDNAIMAELNIPVVKNLDVNLAIRYDDYSDFGGTTNPKVSIRWQPTQQWLFRGSYNEGFRAPTLQDVYSPNSLTFTESPYSDPLLCPNGVKADASLGGVTSRDCNQQFQQQQGGNRDLKPETSKAWSLGAVFQPTDSITVGADYWNYKVDASIGVTSEQAIFGDPGKYADQFVRCGDLSPEEAAKVGATCGGGASPNTLAYITNTTLNLGSYKTSGIDITGTWLSPAYSYGRFSAAYKGTYVIEYQYQLEEGGQYYNNLGVYIFGSPVTRYRQVLQFGWQYAAWSAQLMNRYTSSYTDEDPDLVTGAKAVVAGTNVWDLAVTWSGVKGLALTAGMTNMFNQDPPYSNQSDGFQVGYDFRYSSPIGRAFLLRANYTY